MGSLIPEPAHKIWVEELNEGSFEEIPVNQVRYFRLSWGSISKIRIMGLVVNSWMSDDRSFAWIEVHDGSGSIRIKAWDEDIDRIKDPDTGDLFDVGSLIDVIGRIRSWKDTIYIRPLLVMRVEDPNYILIRELEILRRKLRYKLPPKNRGGEEGPVLGIILKILKEIGPLSMKEIADLLKIDEDRLAVQLEELMNLGLIYEDNGRYVYMEWG